MCAVVGQHDIIQNVQHSSAKTAHYVTVEDCARLCSSISFLFVCDIFSLEDRRCLWFREVTAAGVNADGTVLRKKASNIALLLGMDDFQAR